MRRLAATVVAGLALSGSLLLGAPGSGVISHGPRDRRWVALTFDADMTPGMLQLLRSGRVRSWYDAPIVRYLRRTRTPATIFVSGLWAETYPGVVRSLGRDPLFELANHSWDHAGWAGACYGLPAVRGTRRKRREVTWTADIVRRLTGRRLRWFRFPGGCHTAADVRLVESLGERVVQWDVISGDAYLRDPAAVAQQVLRLVRPGSIVVMHLVGAPNTPATAGAVRRIVPALRERGYRPVILSRLLFQG